MVLTRKDILETITFVKKHIQHTPSTGLLTGTGFFDLPKDFEIICKLKYSQLPNFPVSTVKSHKSRLVYGKSGDNYILIFQGRFHLYEGYSPQQVSLPVRVMQELGVKNLILTNAAGGINLEYRPGDIMLIKDHINLTGQNPLAGPNNDDWGIRFPDMSQVYNPDFIVTAKSIASKNNIQVHSGVYAGLSGPSLETPAEIKFLKTIGSDAVGLSTIMEAIAGVHAGMKILGLSLITNVNDPENPVKTTIEDVLKTAEKSLQPLNRILAELLAGNAII